MRLRAAGDNESEAPSATAATWRQDRGPSSRMSAGIGRCLLPLAPGAPPFEVAPIALERPPHVARAAHRTRFAQNDLDPGDAEFLEEKHGDVLGESFDQVKLRALDERQ